MTRITLAAALLASTLTPILAADPLTVEQVLIVANGLALLDGYEDVCTDGAVQKTCKRPYKFSGGARWTIANALGIGRAAQTTWQGVQAAILAPYTGADGKIPDASVAKANREIAEALAKPAGITMPTIKHDELKLDDNPIPPSVLSLLMPILE